ncbi:hypothetical protein [Streptomyces sp. NPDC057293]|uniref:hypothetical protein n=1 Tax=unclassified Streptomyces TaxID=2593676 RepID=UPI003636F2F6
MNQSSHTSVQNPQGFLHTGPGDMYVNIGTQLQEVSRNQFRRIAKDQLIRLRRVLVAPAGMGEARAVLAATGTVILQGEPGSGRTAAAKVLLREHHSETGVLQELLPGEEDELSLHNPALVGDRDQLLLDLSGADDRQWSMARVDLPALRRTVQERHAHLAVVMPHGAELDPELHYCRVELTRPPGLEVLRRHLHVQGMPHEQYAQPDVTVRAFLSEKRPMREIADFADLIGRAKQRARPDQDFAQWCAAAKKARNDRTKEVAALVRKLDEAPQRALLIAVSMLHGAHADVIHRAAALLLRTVDFPPEPTQLLQHKDLAERFGEISCETAVGGLVRFKELDYEAAVRAHFWDHMPDLRPYLGTWVADLAELNAPHVDTTVRTALVTRLAEQYLRTGNGSGLASLAERWSSSTAGRARLEAAVHALVCGLNDPAHARDFRRRIYDWCANRRLPGEFAQVLVRVCAEVLAVGHPDQALLRLYYLARRERGSTRALQALCDLVARSRGLRRRLLDRLAGSELSPPDLDIFLRTCDPLPLTVSSGAPRALLDERDVQRALTTCWHAALTSCPPSRWQPNAELWLHRAADSVGRHRELLLDVLVGAAERCGEARGEAYAALYACSRSAERTARGSVAHSLAVTEQLLCKITAAQSITHTMAAPASVRRTQP